MNDYTFLTNLKQKPTATTQILCLFNGNHLRNIIKHLILSIGYLVDWFMSY